MEIRDFLKVMVERDASDIYLTVDSPPAYRIEGVVQVVGDEKLTDQQLEALAHSVMREGQRKEFAENMEMNLALSYEDLGRFRVNIFRQRENVGFVIRQIKAEIVPLDKLDLMPVIENIALYRRGLALFVGATGCGKSTTLAAMIDHRNSREAGHIISIEDPIEFVHRHKKSIITQREVGFDTHSFQEALKNTLRQAPDVILIGEIRDKETMEAAITFSETGHLCMGTLHANNANQAIERILNFFPAERHTQIYLQLSMNLRAIVSQRLIRSVNDKRVPVLEVLLDTPRIKDLIKKGEIDVLKEAMEQGIYEGCQTFDHALFMRYKEGRISLEQALINADSTNNLRLKIKLDGIKGDDAIDKLLERDNKETKEPKEKGASFQIQGMRPAGRSIKKI